jgi:hypothetical protein
MKELVPMTELNFDKGDVAAIAVAEAEKTMRQKVKSHHAAIADCEKAIEATKNEVVKQGEILIEKKLSPKIKNIKAGLKATKVPNLTTQLEITVHPRGYAPQKHTNKYKLEAVILDKDDKNIITSSMTLESGYYSANQLQIMAMNKLEKLKEQKADLVKEAMKWRKRLGDISTLERQFKAMIARDQIERTKDGKALIAKLLKNFDPALDLLGDL